jgi:hypothetical protein
LWQAVVSQTQKVSPSAILSTDPEISAAEAVTMVDIKRHANKSMDPT